MTKIVLREGKRFSRGAYVEDLTALCGSHVVGYAYPEGQIGGDWVCGFGAGQESIVPTKALAERVLREQRSLDAILADALAGL